MIEAQRVGERVEGEGAGLGGVVSTVRLAIGAGDEDGRDGVAARVATGVRVGEELFEELDPQARLLEGLAAGRLSERLADVDEAAGEGPSEGGYFRRTSTRC
jgi:hypothetical protein